MTVLIPRLLRIHRMTHIDAAKSKTYAPVTW